MQKYVAYTVLAVLCFSNSSAAANRDGSLSLAAIRRIGPKGRVQDIEYNADKMLTRIVAGHAANVPWLIQQLSSEAPATKDVLGYWPSPTVGDVAFVILTDLAARIDGNACLPGGTWSDILGNGDGAQSGHAQLHAFIRKHGRKELKARWLTVWEHAKDRISWDDREQCLTTTPHSNVEKLR